MGPIDIRYHVVSIVAIFLALGVGIVVGSSTNFLGINSILKRQDAVIRKLEYNYKEIRKEIREAQTQLVTSQDYVKQLETNTIPKLMDDKLGGLALGIVTIGEMPDPTVSEEVIVSPIKTSGASLSFRVKTSLADLTKLTDDDMGGFIPQFGKELIRGNTFGSKFTSMLSSNGALVSGGFDQPVGGIIFVIGKDIDSDSLNNIVIPLQKIIRENQGLVFNCYLGEQTTYADLFSRANHPFFQNVQQLDGLVEMVSAMSDAHQQKKGLVKIAEPR